MLNPRPPRYCVVPALTSSSGGRSAELLTPGTPAVSPGTARGADGGGNAAVRAQVSNALPPHPQPYPGPNPPRLVEPPPRRHRCL
eukprot:scaffold27935_cov45-Isochrysis_galbana.AAC.1